MYSAAVAPFVAVVGLTRSRDIEGGREIDHGRYEKHLPDFAKICLVL